MLHIPSSNRAKYVCARCRTKIPADDLETIVRTELRAITFTQTELARDLAVAGEIRNPEEEARSLAKALGIAEDSPIDLASVWPLLVAGEKRTILEQLVERIVVDRNEIDITFHSFDPASENAAERQRSVETLEPDGASTPPRSQSRTPRPAPPAAPPRRKPSRETTPVPGDQETLTLREAASLLRLSESRVRMMIADGRLPAFRTGTGSKARIRVWRRDLEAAAAENFRPQSRPDEAVRVEEDIQKLVKERLKRR